jgi:serine/threonine-protein kinase
MSEPLADAPHDEEGASRPRASIEALYPPGSTLAAKYEIVRVLGSGGMGVVYEARNVLTDGRVALKVVRPEALAYGDVPARLTREARAAGSLRSAHVARVLDADHTDDGLPFLVIELLEGDDLHAEAKRRGRIPPEEAIGYVLEACAGLAEAHARGFIHRDLKPANLFLAAERGRRIVKVLDFGIAKNLDSDEEITRSLSALGTPSYMSPEQIRDAKNVDHRADIWALGVIAFRLMTGELPFKGSATAVGVAIVNDAAPDPSTLEPSIPAALGAVVLRSLRKDPGARYPNVAVLARALAPFAPRATAEAVLAEIDGYASLGGRVDFAPTFPVSSFPPPRASDPTTVVAPPPTLAATARAGRSSLGARLALGGAGAALALALVTAGVLRLAGGRDARAPTPPAAARLAVVTPSFPAGADRPAELPSASRAAPSTLLAPSASSPASAPSTSTSPEASPRARTIATTPRTDGAGAAPAPITSPTRVKAPDRLE